MRLLLGVALISTVALGGEPVLFCVGERAGAISVCAPTFAALGSEQDGQLFVSDQVGNTADWGLFCSWRGVRVSSVGVVLTIGACDEAKRRLDIAAEALTAAGLVELAEWPRVAKSLAGVLLYPSRALEVPGGEALASGVFVPATRTIHLTATLEGAPHEFFHAVLQVRGGSIDHDAFNSMVDFVSRAFRAKYRASSIL